MDQDMNQDMDQELAEAMGGSDVFDTLAPSEKGMARKTWAQQEKFLAGHRLGGTVSAGCDAAQCSRRTVVRWRADDRFGFLARMDGAHEDYADRLERIGLELIQELRPGQNTILLLAYLNAHRSRLFRPQATPDITVARDTLAELRRLRQHVDTGTKSESEPGDSGTDVDRLLQQALTGKESDAPSGATGNEGTGATGNGQPGARNKEG